MVQALSNFPRKNNSVYLTILGLWLFCLFYFNPRLFEVLRPSDPWGAKISFWLFVALLNLFWLYCLFHLVFFILRFFPLKSAPPFPSSTSPAVAILYATKNDFQEKALLSCLRQAYEDFHVFILDDSTETHCQTRIDQFHERHPFLTTVVRRPHKEGFKAGNLNHTLRFHTLNYPLFAVIDADEVIPETFLQRLVPYVTGEQAFAFAQANHAKNPVQPSKFASDLSDGIDFHWDIYQLPRNRHGCVIFYGHGAVIRRDAWVEAGGFPEIVSEDLAFSTRLRQLGYQGVFVPDVACHEDFPETYPQFRRRHEKWVQGACEYMHRELLPFLRAPGVGLAEKLDVLFSSCTLFIPALFFIFLLVANAILPITLADKHTLSVTFGDSTYNIMPAYFLEPRFRSIWTWDFYIITLIGMFSPIFCYFRRICAQPRRIIRLLFKSAVPYIALIHVTIISILRYLLTRKAVFISTGDKRTETSLARQGKGFHGIQVDANHRWVFHAEWISGAALTYLSLMTMNFALLTISAALMLSPLIARLGWENRFVSIATYIPLFFVLLAFGSTGLGFLGIQGFSIYFLAFHF